MKNSGSGKIQLLTPTLIRTLAPHSGVPMPAQPLILSRQYIDEVSPRSVAPIVAEDQEEVRKARKARLNALDKDRQSSELTDIQKERKEKNNYLLAKAQLQKDEEEDSIKKLNEMVIIPLSLSAWCSCNELRYFSVLDIDLR